MIGTLIRRQYGIKLSAISVGRLLAQMGLSCQKPLSRAFEQDATLVKQWIERDFPKIRALAKKERAVMFFADESGVRSDFHAGTTWGIRGKTPVVRHTGKRFHLNMLSAISAKGELRFMTSRKRLSAALFIEFLRRLITNYPKKIFLVVDGLPAHKAKSVHRFVHQVKDRPHAPVDHPSRRMRTALQRSARSASKAGSTIANAQYTPRPQGEPPLIARTCAPAGRSGNQRQ